MDALAPGSRRVWHEALRVVRGASRTHQLLRSRIVFMFGVTVALDAAGTLLMYLFEHADTRSGFHSLGGALFWVTTQLTTVSSQLPNPVSTPGRVLDIVFQVWAISAVASLAASLAAFFHARHLEALAADLHTPGGVVQRAILGRMPETPASPIIVEPMPPGDPQPEDTSRSHEDDDHGHFAG